MNRLDIIRAVARVLTTKGEAAKAVETTFETIRQALRSGDKVVVSNFGTFRVKGRQEEAALVKEVVLAWEASLEEFRLSSIEKGRLALHQSE